MKGIQSGGVAATDVNAGSKNRDDDGHVSTRQELLDGPKQIMMTKNTDNNDSGLPPHTSGNPSQDNPDKSYSFSNERIRQLTPSLPSSSSPPPSSSLMKSEEADCSSSPQSHHQQQQHSSNPNKPSSSQETSSVIKAEEVDHSSSPQSHPTQQQQQQQQLTSFPILNMVTSRDHPRYKPTTSTTRSLRQQRNIVLVNYLSFENTSHHPKKSRAIQQWQHHQMKILEAIHRQLSPRVRRRLLQHQQQLRLLNHANCNADNNACGMNHAWDIRMKCGGSKTSGSSAAAALFASSSASAAFATRLQHPIIAKMIMSSRASLYYTIPKDPAMDYGMTKSDAKRRLSIGTDIEEVDCCSLTSSSTTEDSDDISPQESPGSKSSVPTKGKGEKEQQQQPLTSSPTGVGDPILSISYDLMNAPSLIFTPSLSSSNSSFNNNHEGCIPLIPQEKAGCRVLSRGEGSVAIRVVTDDYGDAVSNDGHYVVTDEESLNSVELELIKNEKKDHRESLKTTSDEVESSNSLKTKRGVLDDAATGGSCINSQTTPIDKQLFTRVDQMTFYVNSPRSTSGVVSHNNNVKDNANHNDDDDDHDQLKPTKLDLVFLTQDCNESFMSELTFATADGQDQEESYLYDCGCVIADHIFEGLDLLCY